MTKGRSGGRYREIEGAGYTRVTPVYLLYSLLLTVATLLALPVFAWRGRRTGKYVKTFGRRLGRLPPGLPSDERPVVWIHAVSVGEVLAVRPLLGALREALPGHVLLLSTTTLTGQGIAERHAHLVDGVFYAPFDWASCVRPVLDRLRPRLLVLVETELWPRLVHEAHVRRVPVAVVNGRISPGSFAGYRRIRWLLSRVLAEVDLFAMQAEPHAGRIVELGAPRERVCVLGNLKYDALEQARPAPDLERLLGLTSAPLWVAGSTAAGEEEAVLAAHRHVRRAIPQARLLIAPRHPERFAEVCRLVEASGEPCRRRSALEAPWDGEGVLVLDTLGELASVFPLATAAFVGGSLVRAGGHNILEAAVAGKAVVVGPHMENFQEMAEAFLAEGGLTQVPDAGALGPAMLRLLTDASEREARGRAARALVERHRGAAARTAERLAALLTPLAARAGAAPSVGVA